MKLQFICGPFLQHLTQNDTLAQRCWENAFDTGLYYFEQMMWEDALPYLGQAYETSIVIYSKPENGTSKGGELLTATALAYLSTLANLGMSEFIAPIYRDTRQRLQELLQRNPDNGFWLTKFDEQIHEHKLHPELLSDFTGMLIVDRTIYPQSCALH